MLRSVRVVGAARRRANAVRCGALFCRCAVVPTTTPVTSYPDAVTFANVGSIGTLPHKRDELVAHLTARSDVLMTLGCQLYEVGVNDEHPNTVFVMELWESADAHRASLQRPEIQESIAQARPWLSGEFGGFQFAVKGSPLRD